MKELLTRRNALIAAGAAAVLAGGTYEAVRLVSRRHAPSVYDDLLAQLDDRDADAQIGEAVMADVGEFDANATAAKLRTKLARTKLAAADDLDAAQDRLVEAQGWVLPETFGLLCALAAKAAV